MVDYDMTKIQIYFDVISKIEPQSIIDASMYLKQIGAITRTFQTYEIPAGVYMVGIETDKNPVVIPELENVYNDIRLIECIRDDEFCQFELGTMFDCGRYMDDSRIKKIIEILKNKCMYIFMDEKAKALVMSGLFEHTLEINYGETKYYICS